jgi:hypothetical protein
VGLEQMSCCSAQRPRQRLIRVPVVQVGICEPVWDVDGIFKTIAELRLSNAFEFSILAIEKAG